MPNNLVLPLNSWHFSFGCPEANANIYVHHFIYCCLCNQMCQVLGSCLFLLLLRRFSMTMNPHNNSHKTIIRKISILVCYKKDQCSSLIITFLFFSCRQRLLLLIEAQWDSEGQKSPDIVCTAWLLWVLNYLLSKSIHREPHAYWHLIPYFWIEPDWPNFKLLHSNTLVTLLVYVFGINHHLNIYIYIFVNNTIYRYIIYISISCCYMVC